MTHARDHVNRGDEEPVKAIPFTVQHRAGSIYFLLLAALLAISFSAPPLIAQDSKTPAKSETKSDTAESEEQAPSDTGAIAREQDGSPKEAKSKKATDRWHALVVGLTVFVLAIFVGFEVIAKVPPTLHTPLMSGSNAISGIIIVGAVMIAGQPLIPTFTSVVGSLIGMIAVVLATINVVGGFLVTHRMLAMFKRR